MTVLENPRERVATWRRDLGPDRLLTALLAATVAVKVAVYAVVAGTDPHGDEQYYFDAGRAVSNGVRDLVWAQSPDTAELSRVVIGNGWFMPGQAGLLAPLFLIWPAAPDPAGRLWLGVVSTLVLVWAFRRVRATFGDLPAGVLLVFPGLVPTYALFGVAAWADANSGLLVVVLLCRAVDSVRRVRAGDAPTWHGGLELGLLAIAAVYLRSSLGPLVVAMLGVTFVTSLLLGRERAGSLRQVVAAYAAAGVAFLALLAPWTVAVSSYLDDRVLTTSSVDTGLANTFGDRDEVCFGDCDPYREIWFPPVWYAEQQARATGVPETEVLAEMSAYARREVTAHSYARDVVANTMRYVSNPAYFASLLEPPGPVGAVFVALVFVLTGLLCYPSTVVLAALPFAWTRRSLDDRLQLALIKVAVLALLVQPFVHVSGPRYWTTMAPLLALGAALGWRLRRARVDGVPREDVTGTERVAARWLDVVQLGLTGISVAVVVAVVVLAL